MKGFKPLLAAATAVLSLPFLSYAQTTNNQNWQNTQNTQPPIRGSHEAALMKPASATLIHSLDASKDKDGYMVRAKLDHKVTLSNGTVLPSGTMLIGKVTNDDMQEQGMSKLALRFYEATLKDGKTVPIRATIVGVYTPGSAPSQESYAGSGQPDVPNEWTARTLQMDQIDALPGVDLHSKISSNNSAVFVSRKKDDVKVQRGSELQFAIAPANQAA